MKQTPPATLKPLTSLRFFAALAVFLCHCEFFKHHPRWSGIYDRFFAEGYLGVTFFFVLSGFILTYNYQAKITTLNWLEIKKFYIARFARIYPVHFLTFWLAIPVILESLRYFPVQTLLKAAPNLLLLQSHVPRERVFFSYNSPSWSLCNEFFFYAWLPLILFAFARLGPVSRKKLGFAGVLLWVVTLGVVAGLRGLPFSYWLFYIAPVFRLLDFTLGVIAGLIFLQNSRRPMPDAAWTTLELLVTGLLLLQICTSNVIPQDFRYGVYYMPVFTLAVYLFACQRGLLSRWLSRDWMILLGEVSFSFYMFHQLVLRYLEQFCGGILRPEQQPLWTASMAFGITCLLSYLCYQYYEKWMRDFLRTGLGARFLRQPVGPSSSSAIGPQVFQNPADK